MLPLYLVNYICYHWCIVPSLVVVYKMCHEATPVIRPRVHKPHTSVVRLCCDSICVYSRGCCFWTPGHRHTVLATHGGLALPIDRQCSRSPSLGGGNQGKCWLAWPGVVAELLVLVVVVLVPVVAQVVPQQMMPHFQSLPLCILLGAGGRLGNFCGVTCWVFFSGDTVACGLAGPGFCGVASLYLVRSSSHCST